MTILKIELTVLLKDTFLKKTYKTAYYNKDLFQGEQLHFLGGFCFCFSPLRTSICD